MVESVLCFLVLIIISVTAQLAISMEQTAQVLNHSKNGSNSIIINENN